MRRLIFPILVLVVAAGVYYWPRGPKPTPIDTSRTQGDRLQIKSISRIEPGTRVGDGPPAGWTHLILKTRPLVNSGDVAEISAALVNGIRKFSTSVILRTEPDPSQPGRFRIGTFAAGLGVPVDGQDVIVTTTAAEKVGVALDFFEGMVLQEREKEIVETVSPAVTPTMAVVDFPAHVLRGTEHVKVVMRYASLVNAKDGGLDTLFWVLDLAQGGDYSFSGDSMIRLEPNQTMDWELHVDGSKMNFLGQPKPDAFATTGRPRGPTIAVNETLKSAAAATSYSETSASALEKLLRELLAGPKTP
jgi:hypothetical protein